MADPLGLIGAGGLPPLQPRTEGVGSQPPRDGAGRTFKDALLENLDEANRLQREATRAVEDLQSGKRTDLEGVILATQKADDAFRMLQSLRNRMMEAYEEIKQMRT